MNGSNVKVVAVTSALDAVCLVAGGVIAGRA
jgi:hypothetical protein